MNRNRALGFLVLLVLALLLFWAAFTGRSADLFAAFLTPAYLEPSS